MKKELEKILEDEKFVEKIISMETKEEAKKAIEEKGVSVTDEEMNEIHDLYSAVYEECKKMKKEDLEKIAGGAGIWGSIKGFFVGSPVQNATERTLANAVEGTANFAGNFANAAGKVAMQKLLDKANAGDAEKQIQAKELDVKMKELENQTLMLQNQAKNGANSAALKKGVVYAALIALGYKMFGGDIKAGISKLSSWIDD